jgi:hypothetical protein
LRRYSTSKIDSMLCIIARSRNCVIHILFHWPNQETFKEQFVFKIDAAQNFHSRTRGCEKSFEFDAAQNIHSRTRGCEKSFEVVYCPKSYTRWVHIEQYNYQELWGY